MRRPCKPVVVEPRELIRVLRAEAASVCTDRRTRDLVAAVAARDLVAAGTVRLRPRAAHP
jgi:hypothetical protein